MVDAKPATLRLQVARRDVVAEDVLAFELRDPAGADLPPFEAGAHIDVHLPADAPVSGPRVRCYSLCNAPSERQRYCVAVQREPAGRGGSRWLHQQVQVGDVLSVGPPRNAFALRPAPHTLLLGGGIGLTPLLAMAEALWAADQSFELHVAVRSAARLAFAQRLRTAPWAGCVQVHVDGPGPALDLAALLARQPPQALAFACGPTGFMAAVQGAARQLGWADGRVVVEHFAAPAAVPAGRDEPAVAPEGLSVLWAPSGQRVNVAPQHSVAQALIAAGIDIPLSCEQGICGQCCVQVLAGQPDHRDMVYGEHEHTLERRFTPCCSRALSAQLVLAPLGWADPAPGR
ncbi:PDR/VanB family oxidoreductase [Aquabacterium sp. OR-4]|uniref:PDR/VanB family oxidoreductase n=1 Tax=Aquabacterium sp. OR-4 TaxID=2978127 RepID=UPI0021B3670E|nr:PDR/VanB family oxidoreductase [Aquabacterium sp. OR-4]MDT7837042.1 PDR/VanB family oxidoreductase [Aquabacterium sp. OR-4]